MGRALMFTRRGPTFWEEAAGEHRICVTGPHGRLVYTAWHRGAAPDWTVSGAVLLSTHHETAFCAPDEAAAAARAACQAHSDEDTAS